MYKTHRLPLSLALVPVVCPQPGNLCKRESEEEGVGEMTLQSFEFGLQYLFQPLAINITYCTWDSLLKNENGHNLLKLMLVNEAVGL